MLFYIFYRFGNFQNKRVGGKSGISSHAQGNMNHCAIISNHEELKSAQTSKQMYICWMRCFTAMKAVH